MLKFCIKVFNSSYFPDHMVDLVYILWDDRYTSKALFSFIPPPMPMAMSRSQTELWLGVVKVLCILRRQGFQLILAYSWARPAILIECKNRGGMFLFLLCLHFQSCSSFFLVPLFHLLFYSISFLPFSGRHHKMTHKGWHIVKPQHNQSKNFNVKVLQ